MVNKAALPTESMIVVGMEAIGFLQRTDEYKRMTGCQQGAELARVCWAAMVAEMRDDLPRQTASPSDTEILAAWAESHWITWEEDPKGLVKFARLLLDRYANNNPHFLKMITALETIAAGNTDPDQMVEIAKAALEQDGGD